MVAKRKRAKGGGRKAKGPFTDLTSTFTVRMPKSLREELESAARASGKKSVSQELLVRLSDTFSRVSRDTPPHLRSLSDALKMLVAAIEHWTGKRCTDDAFTAEAVRHAIRTFLLRVMPIPEGAPPIPRQLQANANKVPNLKEGLVNPLSLGELECARLMAIIESAPLNNHDVPGLSYPAPEGLSRIRLDLGVGTSKEKNT